MNGSALIDSSFLRKLELLAVHWQKSFPGLVGGHNASRFAGPGQEFLDHRHFHHGDDLRAINWRAYLRLEKLFLKMFQVEPRVPVRLLLDCSRSMEIGDPAKFDYARRLAAALCYIGLVRLDTICLQPFADNLAQPFLSSGGRHQFVSTAEFLSSLAIREHTDFFRAARDFIARYPQRGLLIVISDFLDDVGCEKPLQFFADYGHELMLIHLWAEEDRTPPWDGQLELIDSETGDTLNLAFGDRARDEYTASFDRFAEAVKAVANRSGGRYVGLSTAIPIEEAVFGPIVQFGGIE
ncbi:MAG: DUF58 domain-containing protein [Bryobacteraceae bacterium]